MAGDICLLIDQSTFSLILCTFSSNVVTECFVSSALWWKLEHATFTSDKNKAWSGLDSPPQASDIENKTPDNVVRLV